MQIDKVTKEMKETKEIEEIGIYMSSPIKSILLLLVLKLLPQRYGQK